MTDGLFEQLDFEPNALFEKIIAGLMETHYCQLPDFLSPGETAALRKTLLQKYQADQFKKAAIGNRFSEQVQREVRGDFIFWIDREAASPAETRFLEKVDHLVAYLNRTCFLGIARSEFHYALYPPGSYYQRHLDVFQNDDRRKLSLVCYLNEADWRPEDGGALVLYPGAEQGEEEVVITPTSGRLVIFESQVLEHEVKPAGRQRLSLTGWLKTH
jgi:SM-20-related protein